MASVLAGAGTAALGALILGEYQFSGYVPWVAGVVLGLVVAEVMVLAGRWRGWVPALAAAALSAGGLAWAGWISSGQGIEPYPLLAWVSAAVGAAAAGTRAGARPSPRRSATGR